MNTVLLKRMLYCFCILGKIYIKRSLSYNHDKSISNFLYNIEYVHVPCYSREVTNLEYFVVLNGTAVIGPQVANATINDPLLCIDCTGAVPVPAVDVDGQLTSDQIVELGLNLDPTGQWD